MSLLDMFVAASVLAAVFFGLMLGACKVYSALWPDSPYPRWAVHLVWVFIGVFCGAVATLMSAILVAAVKGLSP